MLKEWHQLTIYEQESIARTGDERAVYGMFDPVTRQQGATPKVAYNEVALLYFHVQKHSCLPHYVSLFVDEQHWETIAGLVLAGILEIESNGGFIGGTSALTAVAGHSFETYNANTNVLSSLSLQAIEYALLLKHIDVNALAARLYTFNTVPTSSQAMQLSSSALVERFLFTDATARVVSLLQEHWSYSNDANASWLSWRKRMPDGNLFTPRNTITHKLYISPLAKDLAAVFQIAAVIITNSGAFSYKVGNNAAGILRPDKMVVYFDDEKRLAETAAELGTELSSFAAQGVPFTKQSDKNGLLSTGADVAGHESWRIMITRELAKAITQAKANHLHKQETIQFVRTSLLLAGIDMNEWKPTDRFFALYK